MSSSSNKRHREETYSPVANPSTETENEENVDQHTDILHRLEGVESYLDELEKRFTLFVEEHNALMHKMELESKFKPNPTLAATQDHSEGLKEVSNKERLFEEKKFNGKNAYSK